jgi:hypothetical protein
MNTARLTDAAKFLCRRKATISSLLPKTSCAELVRLGTMN